MHKPWNCSLFLIVLFLFSAPPASARASETGQSSALRIEQDEERKAFIFIIDGQSVAFLDKTGLHVRGDINYGGALLNEGRNAFKTQAQTLSGNNSESMTNEEKADE